MEVMCETKTKDNVFVSIKVAVQFQVKADDEAINAAHYRLTNARSQVGAASPCTRSPERVVVLPVPCERGVTATCHVGGCHVGGALPSKHARAVQ
eukprot:6356310-Prymnesium_polylepis.1